MKYFASLSAAAALLSTVSGSGPRFWRMPCHSRTALARLDPVVEKGTISSHGHVIHGGSNFDENTSYDQLRESECTSCAFSDDKSAYWTPSLHFMHASGEAEIVPQIGGMLAYYLNRGEDVKAFPKGFQMLAGDMRLRNFSGPVPDPPTSSWGPEDMTQESLMQKAIGFNCLNYKKTPEGTAFRHAMPEKAFMDQNCANGIRAELYFPSCWNGKDTTAIDHKSHMAYPNLVNDGQCPEGYDTRLPSLLFETIWDTNAFNGKDGQFVWSHGDPTGYGYHGDFINGWDIDVLQSAITQCTNPSGRVEDCPIFSPSLQSEATQGQCEIKSLPDAIKTEDCAGPTKGLCGNVAVQDGPGYADPLMPNSPAANPAPEYPAAPKSSAGAGYPAAPKSTAAPQYPAASQAPASPESPAMPDTPSGPGYPAGPKSPAALPDSPSGPGYPSDPNSPAPLFDSPSGPGTPAIPKYPAAPDNAGGPVALAVPTVTPAPSPQAVKAAQKGQIVSTTTYTSSGIVYEVAVEKVEVTVTVTDDAPKKYRRHAAAHLRKKGFARRR